MLLHKSGIPYTQRRSQDFCLGGPLFHDLRRPARFSGRGGGSSRNFSGSPQAGRIQWGGGVVAEIFRDPHKPARFSGGGVVAEIFRYYNQGQQFFGPVTGGHDHSNHLHSGTLCLHFPQIFIFSEIHCRKKTFTRYFTEFIAEKKHLLHIFRNSLQKKNIYQKFGGGHGPPGPPPWLRHCIYTCNGNKIMLCSIFIASIDC